MSAKGRCKLQAPIKGRNFGAKLTDLCGFWLDVWFFSHVKKTSLAILIGRIIFLTCENHCSLLWLARTHLRMKIYDIAFWWVFLIMYIIKKRIHNTGKYSSRVQPNHSIGKSNKLESSNRTELTVKKTWLTSYLSGTYPFTTAILTTHWSLTILTISINVTFVFYKFWTAERRTRRKKRAPSSFT